MSDDELDPSLPFARQVRDAVLRAPGVAGLSAGVFGEVATYLPGDKVPGVRVGDDGVHVHVVVTPVGATRIPAVAEAVRGAVRYVLLADGPYRAPDAPARAWDAPVHVHVDDIGVDDIGVVGPGDPEVPEPGTRKDEA